MGRSSVQNMTVAVFGCTGYLGRYVVNKLGQHGVRVIAPHRCDQYKAWPLRQMGDLGNINLRRFTLADPQTIDNAMEGSDIVINLIAQDRPSWRFSMKQANVEAAQLIAEACNRHGATLIHVSHLAASLNSKSKFLQTKQQGQLAAQQSAKSFIVVRPGQLFGLEDRFVNALAEMAWLPKGLPVLGDGSAVKYPVFVGDVAEGLLQICLNRHQYKNQVFDFPGPDRFTWLELIEWFNYYTMRKHQVYKFESPKWFNWYSRLGINWQRPYFTADLAVSWAEDERIDPTHLTCGDLGMVNLATMDRMAIQMTRYMRPQDLFNHNLPERMRGPTPLPPSASE